VLPDLDMDQVEAEAARVMDFFRTQPADGLLPGQVKHKIRELAWEHLNFLKTESSLQAALEGLERIEAEDLPRMRLQTDTRQFNHDWLDALDAIDMIQALKLLTQFSLYRKESRGGFFRQDYPFTDNQRWLVHIVGTRRENGELKLEEHPVDLPYAIPKEKLASYFDIDY